MKTNKRFLRSAMLIAVLAALGASRAALADNEVEPNDPLSSAQALVVGSDGTVTVYGEILNTSSPAHRDVDFYSFQAQAGDVVTMNIDGGMKLTGTSIDTVLAVFGPVTSTNNTNLLPLQQVDDANLDPGSIDTADARIDNFHIPTTGTYVVGVTTYPGYFTNSDTLSSSALVATSPLMDVQGGTYTLIISGVTPPAPPVVTPPPPPPPPAVQEINIDVRPGSRDVLFAYSRGRHVFGPGSDADRDQHFEAIRGRFHREGGLPVALLSSADFNAMDVDQTTLRFGATGDEDSLIRCNSHGVDVNHDKLPDLICHFDFRKANFQVGDNNATLTGATKSGQDIEGKGWLKIISGKRHHRDDHDGDRDNDRGHNRRR